MKRFARVLFVAMIAIGLLAQVGRVRRSGERPATAIATIDAGTRLGLAPADDARAFPLSFTSAACGDQIHIDVTYLDGRRGDEAPEAADQPRIARYVFLGSVRDQQDILALRARWLLANALFVAGLRSGRPGTEILRVIIPDACPGLTGLDWAELSPW